MILLFRSCGAVLIDSLSHVSLAFYGNLCSTFAFLYYVECSMRNDDKKSEVANSNENSDTERYVLVVKERISFPTFVLEERGIFPTERYEMVTRTLIPLTPFHGKPGSERYTLIFNGLFLCQDCVWDDHERCYLSEKELAKIFKTDHAADFFKDNDQKNTELGKVLNAIKTLEPRKIKSERLNKVASSTAIGALREIFTIGAPDFFASFCFKDRDQIDAFLKANETAKLAEARKLGLVDGIHTIAQSCRKGGIFSRLSKVHNERLNADFNLNTDILSFLSPRDISELSIANNLDALIANRKSELKL